MNSSAALVQMKGLGSLFQCLAQNRMAAGSSLTLPKTPRRIRRLMMTANQRNFYGFLKRAIASAVIITPSVRDACV